MHLVGLEIVRLRFVGGGVACRRMLTELARAHLRDAPSYSPGYGGTWQSLFGVAAALGHESCIALAFPHLAVPGYDLVTWVSPAARTRQLAAGSGGQDVDVAGSSGSQGKVSLRRQLGWDSESEGDVGGDGAGGGDGDGEGGEGHESALLRVCASGRASAVERLLSLQV